MSEEKAIEQISVVYLVMGFMIIFAGLWSVSKTPDKSMQLMENTIETQGISSGTVARISGFVSKVGSGPKASTLKIFLSFFAIRAVAYLSVAPIILATVIISLIEAAVKKRATIQSQPPSMTAYHTARKIIPVCLFHIPLLYAAIPLEYFLKMDAEGVKLVMGFLNAVIGYYAFYTVSLQKPPQVRMFG